MEDEPVSTEWKKKRSRHKLEKKLKLSRSEWKWRYNTHMGFNEIDSKSQVHITKCLYKIIGEISY